MSEKTPVDVLNREQQNYAKSRIINERDCKLAALRQSLTVEGKAPSVRDMVNAIRDRDVDLKRSVLNSTSCLDTKLRDAFDFSNLEPEEQFCEETYNKQAAVIRAEAQRVLDEIVLGDATQAKKMIAEFCKQ